jgi:hypothetical protein
MNQNVFVLFSAKDLLKGYIVFRVKKFANRHKDYLHMEIQILFVRASKINTYIRSIKKELRANV